MKKQTITFVLNNNVIQADVNPSLPLLDFIRKEKHLTGTKEVCKEGDCGACTVLLGSLMDKEIIYKTITSCIYPIANCRGKHVVTIEGINKVDLLFHQQAFLAENASQCGFCTPGFLMSATCYFLNNKFYRMEEAVNAIAGNICRCTGYHSIKRAMQTTIDELNNGKSDDHVEYLIKQNIIPGYFASVKEKLLELKTSRKVPIKKSNLYIGGGSDLFVQRADALLEEEAGYISDFELNYIYEENNKIVLGSAVTFGMIKESEVFQKYFPSIKKDIDLVASLPVRNAATIGGNLTNASPIGDLTIILLALNSIITLSDGLTERALPLKEYYIDYKKLNKQKDEFVKEVSFDMPIKDYFFSFEKVSKRTYLDIASVNTAVLLETEGNEIISATISAGGVAPVPKVLSGVNNFLHGKKISIKTIKELLIMLEQDISPISDVRGSVEYKTLLLKQLVKAHFIKLFPEIIKAEEIV